MAQVAGLVLTVALLAGLVLSPGTSLHILWDMVIPILPATFLVSPMLWRNVCPLAVFNTVAGDRLGDRKVKGPALQGTWMVGVVLLVVMVPARRFLFNEHGVVLAGTIVAVALLALVGGLLFSRRAGFCNSLCPVLPVEKLYGQSPLIPIGSAVCPDCTGCAARGCYDLAGGRSFRQSLGNGHRDDPGWMTSPMGIFAAAFPGFVIGYFTTVNGPLSSAPGVYGHVLFWMAGSFAVVALLSVLFRVRAPVGLPLLGGGALALYYWYAAPALSEAYGAAGIGAMVIRAAAVLLVLLWLSRALPGGERGQARA